MEEYLEYMKTLRTHMNDVEDQAAKISVEEQMQITTIHTLEIDLNSAKRETKRLMEETEQMVKSRGDICSQILDKQKRVATLESDSLNLSQDDLMIIESETIEPLQQPKNSSAGYSSFVRFIYTLELIQQERSKFSAKVVEKSSYYAKISEDMISRLQEQKRWLDVKLQNEIPKSDDMQTDAIADMPSNGCKGDGVKETMLTRLQTAEAKLDEIIHIRGRLVSENNQMKQSIEQIKREMDDLKPELSAMEVSTLEEEHKALQSEKDGEMEYKQSLQSQLEKLLGISHGVKCSCGEEYNIQMSLREGTA